MLFSRPNLEWGQSGASDQLTGGTCKLARRVRGRRPWLTFRQMGGSWNWYLSGNQRRGAKAGVSQEMSDNLFGLTRLPGCSYPLKKLGSQRGPSLVGGSKGRSCRHTEEHFWINELSQASSAQFVFAPECLPLLLNFLFKCRVLFCLCWVLWVVLYAWQHLCRMLLNVSVDWSRMSSLVDTGVFPAERSLIEPINKEK